MHLKANIFANKYMWIEHLINGNELLLFMHINMCGCSFIHGGRKITLSWVGLPLDEFFCDNLVPDRLPSSEIIEIYRIDCIVMTLCLLSELYLLPFRKHLYDAYG